MLRRIGTIAVLGLIVAALTAVPALAQNPHFGQGPRAATFTDLGQQLQVLGTITGLGSEPLEVTVTATATADTFCFNPGNREGPVPGQTQEGITVTGGTGTVTPDRHGNFTLKTSGPGSLITSVPTVTTADAGCPSGRWTAAVGDVTFSNVMVFVEQPIGSEPELIATFPGTVPAG
jgi:hypothetical protein